MRTRGSEAVFGHNHAEAGADAHPLVSTALYGAAIAVGLRPVMPRAIASLRHARLDMHVLVCISAIGATMVGQWAEGAAVAFLFGVAHLMESWSIERARVAVSELVGHEPGWDDDGEGGVGAGGALHRALCRRLYAARHRQRADARHRAAAVRRAVGDVVLSRADLHRAGMPVRAGDLDAGHGRGGGDLRGPARRAVQGRAGAGARGGRSVGHAHAVAT